MGVKIPKDVNWLIWAIGISWFFWGPADAYYALYLKSFGGSYTQIGSLISLSKLIPLLIAIPFGILADKFSARKMLLYSLAGYLVIPLLYFYAGASSSIGILVIAILVMSVFKMARDVSMFTYIKEQSPSKVSSKVWSTYLGRTNGLWGLGLLAGSALVLYFKVYELFLLIIIGIIIKLFIVSRLSEPKKVIPKEFKKIHVMPLKQRIRRTFTHLSSIDKRVFFMLVVLFVSGFTYGNIDVFMVLLADEINFGIMTIGLLMGFIYTSYFAAIPLQKVPKKIGKFSSMALGQFLMTLSIIAVALFSNSFWWILFIAFFTHALTFLMVRPVRDAIIAGLTPSDLQGEVSGIHMLVLALSNLLGALFFGYISDIFGIKYMFVIIACIYACLTLWFMTLRKRYDPTVKHIKIHPHHSHHLAPHPFHSKESSKK